MKKERDGGVMIYLTTLMRGKGGFTLLELLVVVIIVGILATIALPQFVKTFAKAREAEANTTLSAILTAAFAYFNERVPAAWPTNAADIYVQYQDPGAWDYTNTYSTNATGITITATDTRRTTHQTTGTMTSSGVRTITFALP